ncbi:squalene/phytoene synthase family protein, partial [Akkermansiaceae bacterium]|nr:squalene/phytoene synthase family protein [Akkermansiaceae bacterium]
MNPLGENTGQKTDQQILGQQILKDVSRSFYLSMRLLPATMRDPISLGYLLARASDTLADTEGLDAQLRFDVLTGFSDVLQGADIKPWLTQLKQDVIPKQKHEGEKVLLENIEAVLEWLSSVPDNQQQAIHEVMGHILRGQKLDIERFELQEGFHFTTDDELEEYCYLVAGCVGEFWTEVGVMTVDQFSNIDSAKLKKLGVNYGKALQLINILRDFPVDLQQGRCYIPSVEIEDTKALMTEAARWRQKARSYLRDGEAYAASLRVKRTRIATALPGMIGARTL